MNIQPSTKPVTASIKIPTLAELNTKKQVENAVENEVIATGEQRDEVTQDKLLEVWNAYAEEVKKANKMYLFTLMTSNAPLIRPEHIIEVYVEGKEYEKVIREEKVNLLNHLRSRLQNYALDFAIKIIEPVAKKQLYTSQEKYQHMAEKNPNLAELKKRFNLDIDY